MHLTHVLQQGSFLGIEAVQGSDHIDIRSSGGGIGDWESVFVFSSGGGEDECVVD